MPTGCESAALTDLLRYWGFSLGDTTIADSYMPWSDTDFVYAFRGNPHSSDGDSIMAPGITNTANSFLQAAGSTLRAKTLKDIDFDTLYNYVAIGQPVIVWSTMSLRTPTAYAGPQDGYYLMYYSHAVVFDGYNKADNTVHVSDSIDGQCWRDVTRFRDLFEQMGSQAVVIR